MPELPDLRVLAEAFTAVLSGRELVGGDIRQPLVMRGTATELRSLEGQRLDLVEQRGKFLTLHLGPHRIVVSAMLTGRLGLVLPGTKAFTQTALVLTLGPRSRPAGSAAAPWTHGAEWLPGDDATLELRYRDPKKMGKVYLLPDGIVRAVAGWENLGPDADDGSLDLDTWNERIRRHTGELQNLLKNQGFVAGIGNGYNDEILWAARLAPFRKRTSLAPEETEALWRATHDVMGWAIGELQERVPPRFEVEVRDFLRVHRRGGEPCPRCGATLSQVSPGGFVTTWCRSCQV
jgi:formamidopyrimidine-DNA glycosylase